MTWLAAQRSAMRLDDILNLAPGCLICIALKSRIGRNIGSNLDLYDLNVFFFCFQVLAEFQYSLPYRIGVNSSSTESFRHPAIECVFHFLDQHRPHQAMHGSQIGDWSPHGVVRL